MGIGSERVNIKSLKLIVINDTATPGRGSFHSFANGREMKSDKSANGRGIALGSRDDRSLADARLFKLSRIAPAARKL